MWRTAEGLRLAGLQCKAARLVRIRNTLKGLLQQREIASVSAAIIAALNEPIEDAGCDPDSFTGPGVR